MLQCTQLDLTKSKQWRKDRYYEGMSLPNTADNKKLQFDQTSTIYQQLGLQKNLINLIKQLNSNPSIPDLESGHSRNLGNFLNLEP